MTRIVLLFCFAVLAFNCSYAKTVVYRHDKKYQSCNGDAPERCNLTGIHYCDTAHDLPLFAHHLKGDFDGFARHIVAVHKDIDSVVYEGEKRKVELYFRSGPDAPVCMEGERYSCFSYRYFSDVYGAFFHYSNVGSISLFLDGKPYTRIPMSGDYAAKLFPDNTLQRKWFVSCRNYFDVIDVENEALFTGPRKNFISVKALDSIILKQKDR